MSEQITTGEFGSETYRVSDRVLLVRGDRIRLRGGPVYRDEHGKKHAMGERGTFTFIRHFVSNRVNCLLVSGETGASVVVPLDPKKSKLGLRGYRNRPYKIVKVRR